MSRATPPDAPTQLRLLALVPAAPGIRTEDLGDAAKADGLNVKYDPGYAALTIDGFPLHAALRQMRRTGWLIFNHHASPPAWVRTPKGTARLETTVPAPTFMEAPA